MGGLIDVHTLRHVLAALLPPGGLFERLAAHQDRLKEKARETLVILGGYSCRAGAGTGSLSRKDVKGGAETPLAVFEKHFREIGFASKAWRTREQVGASHIRVSIYRTDI